MAKYGGMAWFSLGAAFVLFYGGTLHLSGQAQPKSCSEMRHQLDIVEARAPSIGDVAEQKELLKFLASVPDDPEDCVTRAAQGKLADTEQRLIRLKLGEESIGPDWLYQCHRIDLNTQRCIGGSPYEDEIPHDTNEVVRTGHLLRKGDTVGSVSVSHGMGCRVKTISVSESQWFFIKGRAPQVLTKDGATYRPASFKQMHSPVLIVSMRCDDVLHYRKAAWLLRWQ